MNFLKELFTNKQEDIKIGLSQFKSSVVTETIKKPEVSICTKNVKLSDLMRRAS